jgi:glycosyltransferase involved in cell wall biosynthesis
MINISVVIPANGECNFLLDSIKSVTSQDYSGKFEIILIHQKIRYERMKEVHQLKDQHINIIHDPGSGIVSALNMGINASKYEWVARLDSDDLMCPGRLTSQANFISMHPEYILVGGQAVVINESGDYIAKARYPINNSSIKYALKVDSAIPHPGVIFLKSAVLKAGGYNETFPNLEDYNLWLNLLKFGKFHNLSETVLKYRSHSKQITKLNQDQIDKEKSRLILKNYFTNRMYDEQALKEITITLKLLRDNEYIRILHLVIFVFRNKLLIFRYLLRKVLTRFIIRIGL